MDIKVKRRTDRSIEVTFSDVSTKTTIPLSISDILSLQLKLANSLSNSFNLSPVTDRSFKTEKEDEDYLPNSFSEGDN